MTATFVLRKEFKAFERRTPLTPDNAKKLIDAGHFVKVETCPDRIFKDSEYKSLGCEIVPIESWKKEEKSSFILGLKELPIDTFELSHRHIYFAHIFKGQTGHEDVLDRYKRGNGQHFDLEYLVDENSRRVAAFGKWAGFVGAAVSLDRFYQKSSNNPYPAMKSFENIKELYSQIQFHKDNSADNPNAIIIGAKGRCGSGANEVFEHFGVETTLWDFEETKQGGPFQEIKDHSIFINCVLMTTKIPPFINRDFLKGEKNLKVIGDVSCDPTSDLNPIPIYDDITSWEEPFLQTCDLEILAVDNLPSLLPRESSIDFSDQLTPHLLNLAIKGSEDSVWKASLDIFQKHIK